MRLQHDPGESSTCANAEGHPPKAVPQGQAPWAEAGRVATLWARPALGQGPLGRAALWGLEGLVQLHPVHGIWGWGLHIPAQAFSEQ